MTRSSAHELKQRHEDRAARADAADGAKRVESGQLGSTIEYVRELIWRDQKEQTIDRLRAMVLEGLASGPARADTNEDWAELEAIARGTAE